MIKKKSDRNAWDEWYSANIIIYELVFTKKSQAPAGFTVVAPCWDGTSD